MTKRRPPQSKWIEFRFVRESELLTNGEVVADWSPIPAGGILPELRKAAEIHGPKIDVEMRDENGYVQRLNYAGGD
jgi:hypothetical protein